MVSVNLELSSVLPPLSLSEEESETYLDGHETTAHTSPTPRCAGVIAELSTASHCSTNDCQWEKGREKEGKKESLFEPSLIFSAS